VDAPLEFLQLLEDRLTAEHGHHPDLRSSAVVVHCLADLHGELPGGHDDERGRDGRVVRVDAVEDRQRECGRLARAGCGLTDEIDTIEQTRDRFTLNGGRLLVAEATQFVEQFRPQTEVGEGDPRLGGGVFVGLGGDIDRGVVGRVDRRIGGGHGCAALQETEHSTLGSVGRIRV